jgi:hypothetical protein
MGEFNHIGKLLMIVGVVIAGMGFLLVVTGGKFPWVGHLPGDISIKGKHGTFYFPLGSSVLISVILSFLLYLFRGR